MAASGLLDEPTTVPKPTPITTAATPSTGLVMSPRHEVEEHVVTVAIGPGGQMVATEDSRPALIRVDGEAVEEKPQLPSNVKG